MINGQEPSTQLTYPVPDPVEPYTPNGRYTKGQRIFHPEHGLGTVTEVRLLKIHVQFDEASSQEDSLDKACLPSARLTLGELTQANRLTEHGHHIALKMFIDDVMAWFTAHNPDRSGTFIEFPFA